MPFRPLLSRESTIAKYVAKAKTEKMKADEAAHGQAEASRDSREPALAVKLKMSRGEEKSARAKYDQLRKRRPDWTAGER